MVGRGDGERPQALLRGVAHRGAPLFMSALRDVGDGAHAQANGRRVKQRHVAANDARRLQACHPTTNLGGREMHCFTQLLVGGIGVALQCSKEADIECIKR